MGRIILALAVFLIIAGFVRAISRGRKRDSSGEGKGPVKLSDYRSKKDDKDSEDE